MHSPWNWMQYLNRLVYLYNETDLLSVYCFVYPRHILYKMSRNSDDWQELSALASLCILFCICGYFRWVQISWKCWQDLSSGGNLYDTTHISLIKSCGLYFVRENFHKDNIPNNAKITPSRKCPRLQKLISDLNFMGSFISWFTTCLILKTDTLIN